MSLNGKCLCGAVSYTANTNTSETHACHCSMCRKFSGGVYFGVKVAGDTLTFQGVENIERFKSSDWAERGFCKICGSSLFYRVTMQGPMYDTHHLALGCIENADDINLHMELFSDLKPAGYSFAENTIKLTKADVEAMFASPSE